MRTIRTKMICTGLAALLLSGCAMNNTEKGALIGAASGAAVGAAVGSLKGEAGKGALIGAGVGVVGGGIWGYILDKQEKEMKAQGIATQRLADKTLLVTLAGNNLKFETGKSTIAAGDEEQLAKLAAILAKNPQDRIIVEGHTDNVGKPDANQVLSEQRANTVKNTLLVKGVEPKCILSSVGYGESQPVASNDTKDGKAQNRRVVLKIGVEQAEN